MEKQLQNQQKTNKTGKTHTAHIHKFLYMTICKTSKNTLKKQAYNNQLDVKKTWCHNYDMLIEWSSTNRKFYGDYFQLYAREDLATLCQSHKSCHGLYLN